MTSGSVFLGSGAVKREKGVGLCIRVYVDMCYVCLVAIDKHATVVSECDNRHQRNNWRQSICMQPWIRTGREGPTHLGHLRIRNGLADGGGSPRRHRPLHL